MSNALTTVSENELIQTLSSSLYPGASVASIKLVLTYCKAAGLDPLQKPCHIVPMWDRASNGMRDVILPGIGLYRTQASRTGQHAGTSEPEFGPDVTEKLGGQEVTYPAWCRVTVKRLLPNGLIAEHVGKEFWKENYAVKGGKEKSIAPNAMWTKRPYAQLAKCATAQALRAAFPELGSQPTAEEMEGKNWSAEVETGSNTAPEVDTQLLARLLKRVQEATSVEALDALWVEGVKEINGDKGIHAEFKKACSARKKELLEADDGVIDVEPKPATAAPDDEALMQVNILIQRIKSADETGLSDMLAELDAMPAEYQSKLNEAYNSRAAELGAAA